MRIFQINFVATLILTGLVIAWHSYFTGFLSRASWTCIGAIDLVSMVAPLLWCYGRDLRPFAVVGAWGLSLAPVLVLVTVDGWFSAGGVWSASVSYGPYLLFSGLGLYLMREFRSGGIRCGQWRGPMGFEIRVPRYTLRALLGSVLFASVAAAMFRFSAVRFVDAFSTPTSREWFAISESPAWDHVAMWSGSGLLALPVASAAWAISTHKSIAYRLLIYYLLSSVACLAIGAVELVCDVPDVSTPIDLIKKGIGSWLLIPADVWRSPWIEAARDWGRIQEIAIFAIVLALWIEFNRLMTQLATPTTPPTKSKPSPA